MKSFELGDSRPQHELALRGYGAPRALESPPIPAYSATRSTMGPPLSARGDPLRLPYGPGRDAGDRVTGRDVPRDDRASADESSASDADAADDHDIASEFASTGRAGGHLRRQA